MTLKLPIPVETKGCNFPNNLGFHSTAMLPQAENAWTIFEAAHLLNRAGFGGNPSQIKALHALGREKAVDSLMVNPSSARTIRRWGCSGEDEK
jgi:hypothetical protein